MVCWCYCYSIVLVLRLELLLLIEYIGTIYYCYCYSILFCTTLILSVSLLEYIVGAIFRVQQGVSVNNVLLEYKNTVIVYIAGPSLQVHDGEYDLGKCRQC